MNKINGILESFTEQEGILRLFVRLLDSNLAQGNGQEYARECLESHHCLSVLLLEDSVFARNLLHQPLQLGFKESNVVVATRLEGVRNAFQSRILKITQDSLFARLMIQLGEESLCVLCDLDFIKSNGLDVGDSIFWHIPENEIMLFWNRKNTQV